MSVKLEDRPIEQVREEVIDVLIFNYSHGVISAEAFERRLDEAIASQDHQTTMGLVADLNKSTDSQFASEKERHLNINYTNNRDTPKTDNIINILGGSNRSGQWQVAKEIRILTLFGGADIDFTDAIFTSPNVTIKVLCLFGGNDIYVPEDINVVSKAFCILGGIDNTAPSIASRQAPTITVEGLVMFGGLDIKVKKTIKEKFVAFANQMKVIFNSKP
ncbi:LiaF domain-containing protein [Alteromonas lipotrueiana]|uniref:LiaF domain-containing protein n=1 Tax=Alteromonas lipotrueiana TaxID=2803815 RepID=UPI001C47677F|nr:LiaF domain-containing protein [Alteromonas lipotrueiana]|tara:strand:+ start:154 stop:807 length:654 start_codon:yes stop_codon:yes gene_type:complete